VQLARPEAARDVLRKTLASFKEPDEFGESEEIEASTHLLESLEATQRRSRGAVTGYSPRR
jgi:hypothetical protein